MNFRTISLAIALTFLALGGCPPVDTPNDDANDPGGDDDNPAADVLALTGRINPASTSKQSPAQDADQPYTVLVQSDQTGTIFRAETDGQGNFEVELPDSEKGNDFGVTIIGPDGRAIGPVVFGATASEAVLAFGADGPAALGTIDLPDNPATSPIVTGLDGDAYLFASDDVTARVGPGGAPIGLGSLGKGDNADAASLRPGKLDADKDGLIDLFDADDDGDGVVDDFDSAGPAPAADYRADFFMNLKVPVENSAVFYGGSSAAISSALATSTVITFEVVPEPGATREIAEVRLLETPGPTYLPIATELGSHALWNDMGYAFEEATDRFQAFIVPNDEMQAGDSFSYEVVFKNGDIETGTRMINYVFKTIPRLTAYGTSGAQVSFSSAGATVNGTSNKPVPFDGTQDLVLVFEPPTDDTGAFLTGLRYQFEVFYDGAGGQLNGNIDKTATWPTPIPNFSPGQFYEVSSSAVGTLSVDNTFTVTLPKEIFPSTVTLNDSSSAAVTLYKIDIAAQSPTGNAAVTLYFDKN